MRQILSVCSFVFLDDRTASELLHDEPLSAGARNFVLSVLKFIFVKFKFVLLRFPV